MHVALLHEGNPRVPDVIHELRAISISTRDGFIEGGTARDDNLVVEEGLKRSKIRRDALVVPAL
jgi:hypothetical protein